MQVQTDILNHFFSDNSAMKNEIVGMPVDCVSIDSFFSILRQAVKKCYEN